MGTLDHVSERLGRHVLARAAPEARLSLVAHASLVVVVAAAVVVAPAAAVAEHSDKPRNMDLDPAYQARHHLSSRWAHRTPVLYSRVKPRTPKFY